MLRDTTSRGPCVRVWPPHTSERRGGGGGCEQADWQGGEGRVSTCMQTPRHHGSEVMYYSKHTVTVSIKRSSGSTPVTVTVTVHNTPVRHHEQIFCFSCSRAQQPMSGRLKSPRGKEMVKADVAANDGQWQLTVDSTGFLTIVGGWVSVCAPTGSPCAAQLRAWSGKGPLIHVHPRCSDRRCPRSYSCPRIRRRTSSRAYRSYP